MFKQKSKTPNFIKRALLLGLPVVFLVVGYNVSTTPQQVEAATSGTINFQARLLTAAGSVVPDGYYNVEFKLYKAASSSGSSQGACTGDANCVWTETRINSDKVRVANGYLTVNLGSVTAFSGGINWDQDMWLTMNIGGTGTATWDGEMNPRLKLTAVPYAFTSGKIVSADGTGSATVANGSSGTICIQSSLNCGFIQNQQSVFQQSGFWIQGTDPNKVTAIIRAPSLATADTLQVQNSNNTSVFSITATGAISFTGTGYTSFTTPNGANVPTKINIQPYDPGSFGQIIAFGLPTGAQSTARAISLFDARSGAHQPTISVFSPNENQVFGLSWDGSSTNAALKSTSSEIAIRTSTGDAALFTDSAVGLNKNTTVTGSSAGGNALFVQGAASGTAPVMIIKGGASPGTNADLLQVQNNSAAALFSVNKDGLVTAARGFDMTYNAGSLFTIQGASSTFVSVDPQNSKLYVGSIAQCGGRFCVAQVVSTGGSASTNTFNYMKSNSSVATATNLVNQDITIEDDSTVLTGTRNNNRAIRIDFSDSANDYSNYYGLQIKLPTTTSTSLYRGNAILVENAATTELFSVSNTGIVRLQNTANSAAAFQIVDAGGTNTAFVVDSTNKRIGVNKSAPGYGVDVVGSINVDATGSYLINGQSINTNGVLNNIAYLSQAQTFTANQLIRPVVNSTSAFMIQNSAQATILGVDTTDANLIANPDFENGSITGWSAVGTGGSVASDATQALWGSNSMAWTTGTTSGAAARFSLNPVVTTVSTTYTASFYVKENSGTPANQDLVIRYSPNGSATADCTVSGMSYTKTATGVWRRLYCSFSSATTPTTSGYLQLMNLNSGSAHTMSIDGVQLEASSIVRPYGLGGIRFNAAITSNVSIIPAGNSSNALEVTRNDGEKLFNVNSAERQVNIGYVAPGVVTPTRLTIGDTGCANGACIFLGESTDDVLQVHANTGIVFTTTQSELQKVVIENDGTFNFSDDYDNQTKGFRVNTANTGIELQSTGSGADGDINISGFNSTSYGGTEVPFFFMDTSAATVYVGSGTTSTPTLFVLSSKTTAASDPTGTDGAMYYNSYLSSMRCYQGGAWADCMGIPKPNTRRTAYFGTTGLGSAFPAGTTSSQTLPTALAGYGDGLSITGAGSTTPNAIDATSSTPAQIAIASAATSGGYTAAYGQFALNPSANPTFQAYASPSKTTNYRMFVGMSSATGTTTAQIGDPPSGVHYAGFLAAAGTGNWQCVNDNASGTPTATTTSVAVAANTGNRFEVIVDSGNRITYKINNVVVCTHTTKMPTATMRSDIIATTTNGTAISINIAWMYNESDF